MANIDTIIYALLGGVLPALVWLAFWLHEDRKNPEPNRLILKTFLLGMFTVVLVLPFQKGIEILIPGITVLSVFLWALLEEGFKFTAGYFGGLHSIEDNEPIDPMIYMITAALGFVALENALFIFGPLLGNDILKGVVTGNLRFIGASLLHVVSSGIIGFSLSISFYRSRMARISIGLLALLGAVLFHFLFNILILINGSQGTTLAFLLVWLGVMILLLAFEKIKTIAPKTY
ncbi:MAG: PrsW family intramembrane metalloprotease [Candidatus Zambryskibacteria bacterium]|nr:PrsW family intramembrane metalloprotease [Candidatus Zambryskibacteria bacterium]